MVECELCGKEFRTTQGRRGHKTFVHNIRADHSKVSGMPASIERDKLATSNSSLDAIEEKLGNLVDRVTKVESTIEELSETFENQFTYMALLATKNETQHLASTLKLIKQQVDKHDRWLNFRGLHEAVIGLTGGPIADIERRLKGC